MAFDPATHGVGTSHPYHPQAAVPCPPQVFQPRSDPNSAARLAKLKATLNQLLGPEYISQRPGPGSGNRKLSYLEGWKAINLANEIFGFDGWASSITSLTVDYVSTFSGPVVRSTQGGDLRLTTTQTSKLTRLA